jgi:hypothetical protein
MTGDTYINIHTGAHPPGEIRGQIVKELLCDLSVGVSPLADVIQDIRLSPVPVLDVLRVDMEVISAGEYAVQVTDMTGRMLLDTRHQLHNGKNEIQIPVQPLAPGVYSLILSDGVRIQGIKFVK